MVSSVTIKCADPTTPSSNITSYVYGANSSAMTPSVAFSNASTMVNGARSMSADLVFSSLRWLTIAAVLGVVGLF